MTMETKSQGVECRQVYHGKNMQFLVLSRRLAAKRTLDVPYIVISINEPHDTHTDAVIAPSRLKKATLRLRFDDVNDPERVLDDCQSFSEYHAKQIVRFVLSRRHEIQGIIVHCHAGISRSAAVAGALSAWLNGEEADFFDRCFSPNPSVWSILSRTIVIMDPDGAEEIG